MLQKVVKSLRSGNESESDILETCLQRIRESDARIHAWVQVAPQKPIGKGALQGIPFAAKDIFETANLLTTFGSPVYASRMGTHDAALVNDLRHRGAVLLGKTHTAAFAYRDPAPTRNPRNLDHTPGGSSSGSAAAVAAGMVPFALGTQTRGSILRPASFCGITGFKPTYGLLPTEGLLTMAKSLDTAGLFTETAADMLLLWELMGFPVAAPETVKYGAPHQLEGVDPLMLEAFHRTIARLQKAAFAVERIELPRSFAKLETASVLVMEYEGARQHQQRWRQHGSRLGALADLVQKGLQISDQQYAETLELIQRAKKEMSALFAQVPIILTPAAIGPAPRGLASTGDPRMNAPWTALGTPAISIPMPQQGSALPLGLQVVADYGHDARVLQAALRIDKFLSSKLTSCCDRRSLTVAVRCECCCPEPRA